MNKIACAFLCVGLAHGATLAAQSSSGTSNPQTSSSAATPAAAAQAAATAKAPQVTDTVTVTAPGEDRDVQTVTRQLLESTPPGTSPIAALASLPSVQVTKADPYGAYEWALRINVRGFNQNQLGFTLDDVPLGDMSYGNLNGLHISRAIIDEDLDRAVVSQGTGALAVASNSNLGATVQFYSSDPLNKRQFDIRQTVGSYNGYRTFGRFDSGDFTRRGTRFYAAGVWQTANKFKGAGDINQHYYQFNAKLTQALGSKGVFSYYADYSNRAEVDYQDLNKVWTRVLGYNTDNYGVWSIALQAANAYNAQGNTGNRVFSSIPTIFPLDIPKLQPGGYGDLSQDPQDVLYFNASGLRKDFLTYGSVKYAFTPKLTVSVTGYAHRNDGRGLWFTPYLPTYNSNYDQISPISMRTSEYGIARGGLVANASYEAGKNTLEGGIWYERETFNLARRFYGTTLDSPVQSIYKFPTNPFYTQWAYRFPESVIQGHIQDTYHVTQRLSVNAGFKGTNTSITGNLTGFNQGLPLLGGSVTSASYAQGKLNSGKPFLPQFGFDYKINQQSEIFADAARNLRAFQAGGKGFGTSPWGTTQAGFDVLTNNLKPETSWSEELGYRFNGQSVQAQASYFHVNFNDRLLAISQGPGIAGNAALLSNVGGVTTNGADAAVNVRLAPGLQIYNALTISRSTYNSDYTAGGKVIPTGGKITVDTPQVLYKNSVRYSRGTFEAHIDSDFMGKRYFTYTNDNSVPGRWVANFGTSYHTEEIGAFSQIKLQFNLSNMFNNRYYSTIGTNGFVASDPTSVNNNTLQVGFPIAAFTTLSARF